MGLFDKFIIGVCVVAQTLGLNPNEKTTSANDRVAKDLPEELQEALSAALSEGGPAALREDGEETESEEDKVQKAKAAILKITNPGVTDASQVSLEELPVLTGQVLNKSMQPTNMDQHAKNIRIYTAAVESSTNAANKLFDQASIQVVRNIFSVTHIWFAIEYLFQIWRVALSMYNTKRKRTTGMPDYYRFIGIILKWACETYLNNRNDAKFVDNINFAISHSNSILSKRQSRTNKRKNPEQVNQEVQPAKGKMLRFQKAVAGTLLKSKQPDVNADNVVPVVPVSEHEPAAAAAANPEDAVPAAANPEDAVPAAANPEDDIPEMD
jgi:hypothetical protein